MTGRIHACKTCGKALPSPSKLIRHSRMHTGERPFKCDLCGKAFTRQEHLNDHQRTHSAKPFKCPQCSNSFNQRGTLKEHENLHSGLKPFKCDICEKSFSRHGTLYAHKKSHRNVQENVTCEDCGQVIYPGWVPPSHCGPRSYSRLLYGDHFQTVADLHRNMKDHLGPLADKCFDCGAEFLAKSRAEDDALLNDVGQMSECLFCEKDLPPGEVESHTRMHTHE